MPRLSVEISRDLVDHRPFDHRPFDQYLFDQYLFDHYRCLPLLPTPRLAVETSRGRAPIFDHYLTTIRPGAHV